MENMSQHDWIKNLYKKVYMDNLPKRKSMLEIKNKWKPGCK